ncbi:MAG: 3'-5' exonuclease [Chlamydiae bacterium]|nr:3'-5' exonuclease [Chlamydiota bacterium]
MLGIFLDTETNGLNARKHKILDIAFKIIDVKTGIFLDEFQSLVFQPLEEWAHSDQESLHVNGFSWEDISKGESLKTISSEIQRIFIKHDIKRGKAVFICQNPSFDRAFFSQIIDADTQESLLWPYHWLDLASMYWVTSIQKGKSNPAFFPWETGLSKDKIAAAYKLDPETKPHRAINGVNHLIACYRAVVGFPFS